MLAVDRGVGEGIDAFETGVRRVDKIARGVFGYRAVLGLGEGCERRIAVDIGVVVGQRRDRDRQWLILVGLHFVRTGYRGIVLGRNDDLDVGHITGSAVVAHLVHKRVGSREVGIGHVLPEFFARRAGHVGGDFGEASVLRCDDDLKDG